MSEMYVIESYLNKAVVKKNLNSKSKNSFCRLLYIGRL